MPSDPDRPAGSEPSVTVQPLEETQPVLLPPRPPLADPPGSAAPTAPAPTTPAVDLTPTAEASAAHAAREHPTVIMTPYGELPAYNADDVLPSGAPGKGSRPARASKGDGSGDGSRPRRTGPSPLGRAVLPLALALVSGVALVAGWTHLQEDRADDTAAPPVTVPAASSTPTAGAAVSQTPVASESPSAVVSATQAPSASSSAAPSATASAAALPVDRSVPVVVLNSTARTGLAAKVAASLRKDGWKVVSVGNYRGGRLALTTVFSRGNAAAVATMRGDLPTKDAVRAPVGAMSPDRLTVVIGADYPRG